RVATNHSYNVKRRLRYFSHNTFSDLIRNLSPDEAERLIERILQSGVTRISNPEIDLIDQESERRLQEFKAILPKLIEELPPKQRQVIQLFFFEGLKQSRVAAALNQMAGLTKP